MRNEKGQFVRGYETWNKGILIYIKCLTCGSTFFVQPYRSATARFCSQQCSGKYNYLRNGNPMKGDLIQTVMGKNNVNWRGGPPKCLDCGNISASHLAYHKGRCRKCSLLFRRGENHPRWIQDRTQLSRCDESRNSTAHREWSKQVKNRDYWKCQISNDDCSGRVEAHHILGWRSHPELRYEIKNGITLCHSHHPRARADEERYVPAFQELVAAKM